MKSATLYDENGHAVRAISALEFADMSDEEKEHVRCGHVDRITGEICKGHVTVFERVVRGQRIYYMRSCEHLIGCAAYNPSVRYKVIAEMDPYGERFDLGNFFTKITTASTHRKTVHGKTPGTEGSTAADTDARDMDDPEEIFSQKDINARSVSDLAHLLRGRRIDGIYAGKRVSDILIDEYTLAEHRIGTLTGYAVVIAYPDLMFYDNIRHVLRLKVVQTNAGAKRFAVFELHFGDETEYNNIKRKMYNDQDKVPDNPIAFAGQIDHTPSEKIKDLYSVKIATNRQVAILDKSKLSCHNARD